MAKDGFEDHLKELQRIVEELEDGGLPLEGQLERYQQGVERLKACHALLAAAETRVSKLVRDAKGVLGEVPLDDDEDDEMDEEDEA